jgi:hypothetical protein
MSFFTGGNINVKLSNTKCVLIVIKLLSEYNILKYKEKITKKFEIKQKSNFNFTTSGFWLR